MSAATGAPEPEAGNETSMEDILSSIRRILSDGEAQPGNPDVLMLDPSMVVAEEKPEMSAPPAPDATPPEPDHIPTPPAEAAPPEPVSPPAPATDAPNEETQSGLVGPEAAAAAAVTLGSLMRTLASERAVPVYRGGPTIEDVVREEIRPLLKAWLDANLPALVERVVQTEIERLMSRGAPLG